MAVKSFMLSVSCLAIGAGVGYIVAEKRLAIRFEDRLARETAEMRVFYAKVDVKKYPTPQAAAEALVDRQPSDRFVSPEELAGQKVAYHKIATEYAPTDENYAEGVDATPSIGGNVFDNAAENDDQDGIQILEKEEFFENKTDFIQSTLTYYEADNTLVDEQEDVIGDVAKIVGEKGLQSFGKKNDDPNVVYIRNNTLQLEFEVVRSNGFYVVEVLGEEPPIIRPGSNHHSGG